MMDEDPRCRCGFKTDDFAEFMLHMEREHHMPYAVAHLELRSSIVGDTPDVELLVTNSGLTDEELLKVYDNGGSYYNGLLEDEEADDDDVSVDVSMILEATVAKHFATYMPDKAADDLAEAVEAVEGLRARTLLKIDEVIDRLLKLRDLVAHKEFNVTLQDDDR